MCGLQEPAGAVFINPARYIASLHGLIATDVELLICTSSFHAVFYGLVLRLFYLCLFIVLMFQIIAELQARAKYARVGGVP